MDPAIQFGRTVKDAQMLQGTGRYSISINVAVIHLQILQRQTASKIKKCLL
jgi:acyl-CoA hydrolase